MTTLVVSVLVSVLTNFFNPVVSTGADIEGSSRFGLVVEDPREMTQEENNVTHWQYCP